MNNEIAKTTTVALYSDNIKKIDMIAKKLSLSRSSVIRIMINQYKNIGELP